MFVDRHYGNDNFIETNLTAIVSVNLAFLQVVDDIFIETGHLAAWRPPLLLSFSAASQDFPPVVAAVRTCQAISV